MKPAWDKLGEEYAASSSVLVGDVDCTADGESLCQEHGISGYPTIKYFMADGSDPQTYQGGRDYDALKEFVSDTLEIKCDVKDPKECSEKEQGYITKMQAKSSKDRQAQIDRLTGMQGGSMKPELKQWLNQRLRILKALEE